MRDDQAGEEVTKREGFGERAVRQVERMQRGTLIGRYVVLDVIGEGGMGVVYAAFDPELDRKVAIKLLQAAGGGSSGGDQAWILREAQALARLSHPNVVAVYDVGSLSGDRVFIAMELVDGESLRAWLEVPRTWREILPVMRAAGAGLAAAHAAGLVHRDFKPENVIVGRDGRVRVMDFGLARLQSDADRTSSSEIEHKSPLSADLTLAGSVVGTPAYMSPQIYEGQPADAKSDQFAFGVALYEALYRTRPFRREELADAEGRPASPRPAPAELGVPAAVQRVVTRALALDPAARFPAMDALLAELAIDPAAARRRWWLAGASAAVVAVIALALVGMSGRHEPVCTGIDRRLAGAWDPAVKQAIRRAFDGTKSPLAAHAYAGVERALDGYTHEWVDVAVDSCRATRARGEQTEEVLSLRSDCLDQRLEELRAFTELLAKADEAVIGKAERGAQRLEALKRCSNVAQLRAPALPPPEAKAKVAKIRNQLAEAKAAMSAGRFGDTISLATAAADAAKAIPFEALEAEARRAVGLATAVAGNPKDGLAMLAQATWLGIRAHRDDVAADGALYAAQLTADALGKSDEAAIWLALGTATATRLGIDRALELHRLQVEGIVLAHRGDLAAAAASQEHALALAKELYHSDDDEMLANDEAWLAGTYAKMGAFAKAAQHYERALASIEASEGKEHPDLVTILSGLGVCYAHTGEVPKARATLERSLAIREHAFGADSPMLIAPLNNIADLLVKHGAAAEAIPLVDRAKAIAEKLGRGHPLYHTAVTTRGEALYAQHRVAEARAELDAVIALEDKAHSPVLVTTLTSRAAVELGEQRWSDAAAFDQRAIAAAEATGGKDSPELWQPLADLARARLGEGKPAQEIRPLLERSIEIAQKAGVTADDLAAVRALAAR